MTTAATRWELHGQGCEFCNCDFGCGCNFGGFPNSDDGSCRAFVGVHVDRGVCDDVDLSGVKCAVIIAWPKAIHEGDGKAAFVVDPATTDEQAVHLGRSLPGALVACPGSCLARRLRSLGTRRQRSRLKGAGRRASSVPRVLAKAGATRSRTP